MSSTAIYARKESGELGSLFLIWCTYHQSLVDLYRIGIPQLFKIRNSVSFPPEQGAFAQLCQKTCAENAQQVARTIAEAMSHGTNTLADTWMETIAYDSLRVMLYYITQILNLQTEQGREEVHQIFPLLQTNVKALGQMTRLFSTSQNLVCLFLFSLCTFCQRLKNIRSTSQPYSWSRGPGLISRSQASCLGQAVNLMT